MKCQSCVRKIEGALLERPGVISITVSLEKKMATVTFDKVVTTQEDVRAFIQDLGFVATIADSAGEWTFSDPNVKCGRALP